MRFSSISASLLPLALLLTPSLASSPTDSSLEQDLKHTEWLLSKTHRMVLRARKNHWKHKEMVFEKREEKLEDKVETLKEELGYGGGCEAEPVQSKTTPSKGTTSKMTKTTKSQAATSTSLVKPEPVLVVTSSQAQPSSSSPVSSTSSPVSVPAPSATKSLLTDSSSKKGLGFERLVDLSPLTPASSWAYNWNSHLFEDPSNYGGMPNGVEFVPMLWKPDGNHLPSWEKDVEGWRKSSQGLTHLLGFNEPDLKGQAEMSVQDTINGWEQHMEPFAKGNAPLKLVSPAVTNGAAPMGLTFLKGFVDGVKSKGMTVDAIALHWYGSPTNFEYFKNHLTEAHDTFGLPIWLTEYGFTTGSDQEKIDFHKKMVAWMDEQPWIERYAAFGDFVGTFVDNNAKVLPLGAAYASA